MQNWIVLMHWGARLVFVVLIALSVWSVSLMIASSKLLNSVETMPGISDAEKLIRARDWARLKSWADSQKGLHSGTLLAAMETGSKDPGQVDRSIRSYLSLERTSLEKGLTALATLGSNAPFIGLFGTVLGIIQAFGALGSGNHGDTSSIMVGISEALIATAIGLFVAIPAVIGYNYFNRKLKLVMIRCESLRDLYLSRLN